MRLGEEFGIAVYRKNLGLKRKELADWVGVTYITLSRWENLGVAPQKSSHVKALCDILGCSSQDLIKTFTIEAKLSNDGGQQ